MEKLLVEKLKNQLPPKPCPPRKAFFFCPSNSKPRKELLTMTDLERKITSEKALDAAIRQLKTQDDWFLTTKTCAAYKPVPQSPAKP